MLEQVVVDSSTAVKWYIPEELSEVAHLIFDDYRAGVLELLAPDLIYPEFGNILWKKRTFRGLDEGNADAAIHAIQSLPLLITPTRNLLLDAYQLAVTHQRSVYDSLYLALSLRENCRFVTADVKLVNALGGALPSVVSLADWR